MPARIQSQYLRAVWRRMPPSVRDQIRPFVYTNISPKSTKEVTSVQKAVTAKQETSPISQEANLGTISVIIPVYNVEEYLEECVTSITAQTYPHLEIILVDDGSTDTSPQIAERLAMSDSRISIVTKDNAGLGAARNTGILASTGHFLSFVDSDDIIPPQAYSKMIRTLDESGSDFVVGTIRRLTDGIRRVPAWAEKLHAESRLAITAEDCPEILQDVFACNKLFRRTFWESNIMKFPEGVLYEDQETTARAYLCSKKFDVISEVVYDWRIRSDNSSITQQKERFIDVRDRMAAIHEVSRLIQEYGSDSTRVAWLSRTLGPDLGQYYSLIPRVDDAYWSELQRGVKSLASGLDLETLNAMSPHDRILVRLIETDDRENAEKVVIHRAEYGQAYPILPTDLGLRAEPTYLPDINYSSEEPDLLLIDPRSLNLKSRLFSIRKTDARVLEISAYAFIEGIDPKHYASAPLVELVEKSSGRRVRFNAERLDHDVDAVDGDPWTSYAGSAFTATIDLDSLPLDEQLGNEEWYLSLSLELGQDRYETKLLSKDAGGTTASMPILDVAGTSRYVCRFSKEHGLSFIPVKQRRFVTSLSISNQALDIAVSGAPNEDIVAIRIECQALGIQVDSEPIATANSTYTHFSLTIPEIGKEAFPTQSYVYKVRIMSRDGRLHHVAWPGDTEALNSTSPEVNNLRATVSGYGYLELAQQHWRIVITDADYDAATNVFSVSYRANCNAGYGSYATLPTLVLASPSHRIAPKSTNIQHSSGTIVTSFSLSPNRWGSIQDSPAPGTYTVRCSTDPLGGESREYWIPVTKEFELRLPQEVLTKEIRLNLGRTPRAGALALHVLAPLQGQERGRYRQRALQQRIAEYIELPLEKSAVLFESFGGKSVTDSGLELFNEMTRRNDTRTRYWSITDRSVGIPEGAVPLIRYSEEWYRKLHSVEYVVNNNNFPFYYRKRVDQKYVQTWHGTPLKRIGNDIPSTHLSLPYVKLMQREAGYWDYLFAQNRFAAEVLPRAFGTECKVLTEGYPRNDNLNREEHLSRRTAIRHELGIGRDKTVILYAPTWRDYLKGQGGQYQMSSFLDFQEACERLGADYVFLIRGHSNVAGRLPAFVSRQCIDVTTYDDINELYTASDLLVTDYSSVMFDYCVTDKPIYLLAPDLERYRDSVRGFYFDFENTSPGPIVDSTAALVDAILHGVPSVYAKRYDEFKAKYASRDDGNAASRIYERIWNPLSE